MAGTTGVVATMEPYGSRRAPVAGAIALALTSLLAVACGAQPAVGEVEPETPVVSPAGASTTPLAPVVQGVGPASGVTPPASPAGTPPASPAGTAPEAMDESPGPTTSSSPSPVPTPRPVPTPDLASIEDLIDAITEALADDAAAPAEEGRP